MDARTPAPDNDLLTYDVGEEIWLYRYHAVERVIVHSIRWPGAIYSPATVIRPDGEIYEAAARELFVDKQCLLDRVAVHRSALGAIIKRLEETP